MNRNLLMVLLGLAVFVAGGFYLSRAAANASDRAALAELAIDGMTCGSCVQKIKTALAESPGVGAVELSVSAGRGRVEFDPQRIEAAEIAGAVSASGYPAVVRQELSVAEYEALRREEDSLAGQYVARVGTRLLPRGELDRRLPATREPSPERRAAAWQDLLQRELLLNAAEQAGIVVHPGEVDERLQALEARHPGFGQQVAGPFASQDELVRQIREDLLIERLIELQVPSAGLTRQAWQQAADRWYESLVQATTVVIFDPVLRAAAGGRSGGCGCCG